MYLIFSFTLQFPINSLIRWHNQQNFRLPIASIYNKNWKTVTSLSSFFPSNYGGNEMQINVSSTGTNCMYSPFIFYRNFMDFWFLSFIFIRFAVSCFFCLFPSSVLVVRLCFSVKRGSRTCSAVLYKTVDLFVLWFDS